VAKSLERRTHALGVPPTPNFPIKAGRRPGNKARDVELHA